jgi:hypothetical protein
MKMKRYCISLIFLFGWGLLSGQVMFPGDANNDGTANYIDLLPVGIAYGVEGPERPTGSQLWLPQSFDLWDYVLPTTFVNGGHIDANGDGVIDSLDIDAIVEHYDLLQNGSIPPPIPWTPPFFCDECPPVVLEISYSQDSVETGQAFEAYIRLLYPPPPPLPELGALGIAIELSYDPDLVVEESLEIIPNTDLEGAMFVTATSQLASGVRLPNPGRVHIASAGRGESPFIMEDNLVATLSIIVVDDIQRDTFFRPFRLEVENLLILNLAEEMVFTLLSNQDSVVLFQVLGDAPERPLAGLISVFPNPAEGPIQVKSSQAVGLDFLRLWDAQGRLLRETRPGWGTQWTIDAAGLPAGLYWLEARRGGEQWGQRVMLR